MNPLIRYYRFMSAYGLPSSRGTWHGELNYQCGRFLMALSVAGLTWLAYLDTDMALNPGNHALLVLRLMLPLASLALPLFKLLRPFWHKPMNLFLFFMVFLELDTALISGLSGGAPEYIGGYIFILTLLPLCPVPRIWSLGTLGASLAVFTLAAMLSGFSIRDAESLYGVKDIVSAGILAGLFCVMLDRMRFRSWRQYTLLKEQKKILARDNEHRGNMLRSLVPPEMLKDLQDSGSIHPACFPDVTLVMLEFRCHPRNGVPIPPMAMNVLQKDLLAAFKPVQERLGLVELKTRGDSVLLASGVPRYMPGHQVKAVLCAMELLELIRLRNEFPLVHAASTSLATPDGTLYAPLWEARAGVHTGPLMAASMDSTRFLFDFLGPTVEQTLHLKSLAAAGQIVMSSETGHACKDFFMFEDLGSLGGADSDETRALEVKSILPDLSDDERCRFPNQVFRDRFSYRFNLAPHSSDL